MILYQLRVSELVASLGTRYCPKLLGTFNIRLVGHSYTKVEIITYPFKNTRNKFLQALLHHNAWSMEIYRNLRRTRARKKYQATNWTTNRRDIKGTNRVYKNLLLVWASEIVPNHLGHFPHGPSHLEKRKDLHERWNRSDASPVVRRKGDSYMQSDKSWGERKTCDKTMLSRTLPRLCSY